MDAKIYKNKKFIIFFLLPAFAFMFLYLFYPFAQNIITSFQKVKGLGTPSKGWLDPWYKNYVKMFEEVWKDGTWGHGNLLIALKNTGITIVATMIGQVGIALFLALLVSNIKKGSGFYRVVFFFPIVVSATALGLLFNLIFQYDGGMINQIGVAFGLMEEAKFNWKEIFPIFTMLTPVIWQYVGFYFIILLTGISGISEELYEAASIDGATRIQRVKYITLPLLKNSISTCVVLAVTGALKVFDLPWTMFKNGACDTWLTGTYMYSKTMSNNASYAAAISILIVVLGVVLSVIVNKLFKTDDELEM